MSISFNDMNKETLGSRNTININCIEKERELLKKGEEICFLPNDVEETWLPEKFGVVHDYGARNYKIALYGTLKSGEAITVVLNNVFPMFEIRVPEGRNAEEFCEEIKKEIENKEFETYSSYNKDDLTKINKAPPNPQLVKTLIVEGKGIEKYDDNAHYVQLYFRSIKARKDYINLFRTRYKTAHDDTSSYYRVVFRDLRIAITKWIVIKNYTYFEANKHNYFNGTVISVDINDVSPFLGDIFSNNEMLYDKTIHCAFDIETYDTNDEKDDVPMPHNATADMFNIGVVFTYKNSDKFPVNSKLSPTDAEYDYTLPNGYIKMFNITRFPTNIMPDRINILCKDKREMLIAFARLFQLYRPNIVSTFNGDDYDWKWIMESVRLCNIYSIMEEHMSIRKIAKYRSMEKRPIRHSGASFSMVDSVASYEFWTKYGFKVNNELTIFGKYMKYPGYINIDIRTQLRKMRQDVKTTSLKSYLNAYKLGDKVDMPYHEMFDTFKRFLFLQSRIGVYGTNEDYINAATALGHLDELKSMMQEMVDISEYCMVDSARCQDLLLVSNIINDRREVASMCYINANDALYYADGMKVRNSAISKANTRGLHISNISTGEISDEKYPGAFVFPPVKGRVKPKPHPQQMAKSLKATYSIWRALGSDVMLKIMDLIKTKGTQISNYTAIDLVDMPECFKVWLKLPVKRPVAGLDFSSLYPSIIMTYNLSPEYLVHNPLQALELQKAGKNLHKIEFMLGQRPVLGWSVRSNLHLRQAEFDELRKAIREEKDLAKSAALLADFERLLIECDFGFFGTILVLLFDERDKVKKLQAEVEKKMEHMQLLKNDEFAKVREEYQLLEQKFKYYKSKQLALKVLMNTFYGETGNQQSSIYFLLLAGAITSAGQYNIKMVANHVQELGCFPYYGDTDSVYISMPDKYFTSIDENYYSTDYSEANEMQYYRDLVEKSFDVIKIVQNDVNKMLINDNANCFLKMAYEEFLFPCEFYGKKKYAGIAHVSGFVSEPSIEKKSLFVKGLDYIKSDGSELLRDICETSLMRSFNYHELDTISEILEEKLVDICEHRNVPLRYFIRSATYKPKKKNISVNTFVERMRVLGMAPVPYERFNYIVVEKYPFKYDLHGRKIKLKVADFWEYANIVEEQKLPIRFDYYMENTITRKIARLMRGDPRFMVECADDKASDEATINNASLYVDKIFKRWSVKTESKGPALQAMYRKVNKTFQSRFSQIIDTHVMSVESDDIYNNLLADIDKRAKKEAQLSAKKFAPKLHINYERIYTNLARTRASINIDALLVKLREACANINETINKRDNIMSGVISKISADVGMENANDYKYVAYVVKNYSENLVDKIIVNALSTLNSDDISCIVNADIMYCKILAIKKQVFFALYVSEELKSRYKPLTLTCDEEDIDKYLQKLSI